MPALDGLGVNPCSLLNTTAYPTLWIADTHAASSSSDSTVFPLIAVNGSLVTYQASLTAGMVGGAGSASMLATGSMEPNSQFSLLQFLSGGGITSVANGGIDYTQLQNIVLSKVDPLIASAAGSACGDWNVQLGVCNGKVNKFSVAGSSDKSTAAATALASSLVNSGAQLPLPETIVDTYIVKAMNKKYTFSTTDNPIMKPSDFWDPSDAAPTGSIIASPMSLLGMLLARGYLLQQVELFNPAEFSPNAALPTPGTESLIYLYQLSLKTGYTLTTQQATRILTLEAKNLRFFGAFLAEYCYYRTRYEWLLQKYFYIYTMQATSGANAYSPIPANSPVFGIFAGQGTGDNQYSAAPLTQSDYLKGLAYQMACLNTRMIDMRYLLGQVSAYYTGVLLQIQQTVNSSTLPGSNTDLSNKIVALNASAKQAQEYMTRADFQHGVMEYNSEKNRYANVLLSLYAFLNIAAVAMIVQLSRS